jgi:hypothetical protein
MHPFNAMRPWPLLQLAAILQQRQERLQLSSEFQWQLATCLRCPLPEIKPLLRRNRRFLQAVEKRRNKRQSLSALRHHLQQFDCPQLAAFEDLARLDLRSRIVASFHFGDFVYGINSLLRHDGSQRCSYVQTLETSQPAYFDNMQRLFADRRADASRQLLVSDNKPGALSHLLKASPCNLVMFADLPPDFGATGVVNFMGRQARFPRGIACLAVRNQVPVLPVICVYSQGRHRILLGKQLEPDTDRLSRKDAIAGISQSLLDFFAGFLKRHPEQWRYLSLMPRYFSTAQRCSK